MINIQNRLSHLRTLSPLDPVQGVYSRERSLKTIWSWYYFLSVESLRGKTQKGPPSPREPAASVSGAELKKNQNHSDGE